MRILGVGGVLTFNATSGISSMRKSRAEFRMLDRAAAMIRPTLQRFANSFRTNTEQGRDAQGRFTRQVRSTIPVFHQAARALGFMGRAAVKAGGMMLSRMVPTLRNLRMSFRLLGQAAGQAAALIRGAAFAAVPLAMGFKKAVGTAASFEQQMSAVRAITKASDKDFEMLSTEAKRMGIQSVFSAKQAGEAMEYLARAGFSSNEIMGALEGTMHAAAAEGIGLGEAADIVASNVRAFGLQASEAGRVADVLALASAKANTNITGLAEGLKYAAPVARTMGMKIEETTATLALLADSGLKGSLAGTALKNALLKLAAPTGRGAERLEELGLKVADANGNFVGMNDILHQLSRGMNKMGGRVNRTAAAAELFGLRGVALTNLLGRLDKAASGGALTFKEFHEKLLGAAGSAEEMAKIRLDNLLGQLTLLKSSIQAAFIELFLPVMKPVTSALKDFIGDKGRGLNGVLYRVQDFKSAGPKAMKVWQDAMKRGVESPNDMMGAFLKAGYSVNEATELTKKLGWEMSPIEQIALGIMDAIDWMKQAWSGLVETVKRWGRSIQNSLGGEGLRTITTFITKLGVITGVMAPILLAFALGGWLLKGMLAPAIKLVGIAFKLAFSPVGLIVGAILLIIQLMRKENESFFDAAKRIWSSVSGFFVGVWERIKAFVEGVWETFKPALTTLYDAFAGIFGAIGKLLDTLFGKTEDVSESTKGVWKGWGKAVGSFLKGVAWALEQIIDFVGAAIDGLTLLIREVKILLGLARREVVPTFKLPMERAMEKAGLGTAMPVFTAMSKKEREEWVAKVAPHLTWGQLEESLEASPKMYRDLEPILKQLGTAILAQEKERKKAGKPDVNVKVDDHRTIENKNTFCVDGRQVASAVSRHSAEIHERAGFKKTPWQRRSALEHGVTATTQVAGG